MGQIMNSGGEPKTRMGEQEEMEREKDFDAHLANGLQSDWTCVHRRRIICIIIYSINTVPCSLA